jgi:hypothetical protein
MQSHGRALPQGVVHLRHGVGLLREPLDVGKCRRRRDTRGVPDVLRSQADSFEDCAGLDLHGIGIDGGWGGGGARSTSFAALPPFVGRTLKTLLRQPP